MGNPHFTPGQIGRATVGPFDQHDFYQMNSTAFDNSTGISFTTVVIFYVNALSVVPARIAGVNNGATTGGGWYWQLGNGSTSDLSFQLVDSGGTKVIDLGTPAIGWNIAVAGYDNTGGNLIYAQLNAGIIQTLTANNLYQSGGSIPRIGWTVSGSATPGVDYSFKNGTVSEFFMSSDVPSTISLNALSAIYAVNLGATYVIPQTSNILIHVNATNLATGTNLAGGPWNVTGVVPYNFDDTPRPSVGPFSTSNYFTQPPSSLANINSGPVTMVFLLKPLSLSSAGIFLSAGSQPNTGYNMQINPSGTASIIFSDGTGHDLSTINDVAVDSINILIFGLDSGGTMYVQLNGGTVSTLAGAGVHTSVSDVAMGLYFTSIAGAFDGNIYEAMISTDVPGSVAFNALYTAISANLTIPRDVSSDNSWSITKSFLVGGNARYTFNGQLGGIADPEIWKARVGDFVNIFNPPNYTSSLNVDNLGTFEITAIGINYFEVANPNVFPQTVLLYGMSPTYFNFYRSSKQNILSSPRYATVSQNGISNILDVVLPCTSDAVIREPPFAAYLQSPTELIISSLIRDFNGFTGITTTTNHGLSIGNQIILDGVLTTNFAQSQLGPATPSSYAAKEITQINAVTLQDGRVFAIGGFCNTGSTSPAFNEILYPQSRSILQGNTVGNSELSYTVNGSQIEIVLSNANSVFNSVPFPGDTLNIVAGGSISGGGNSNQGWYKVISATSTTITATTLYTVGTPTNVSATPITALTDIQVYIANDPIPHSTWVTPGSPLDGGNIYDCAFVLLNNGMILLAGGYTGTPNYNSTRLSAAYLYNPANDTWTATGSMNSARAGMAFTLMNDGTVLVYGGASTTDSTSEIFNSNNGYWTVGPTLGGATPPVTGMSLAAYVPGGLYQAILTGGTDHLGNILNTVYFYNLNFTSGMANWALVGSPNIVLTEPRTGHATMPFLDQSVVSAGLLTDENDGILIVGGLTTGSVESGTVEVLGGARKGVFKEPFQITTPFTVHLTGAALTLLKSGDILVSGVGSVYENQMIFKTKSQKLITSENTIEPRNKSTSTLMLDGSVFLLGTSQTLAANADFTENFSPNVNGGRINGTYTVNSILSPTEFSVQSSPYRSQSTSGLVTLFAAPLNVGAPGPYCYDTAVPFGVDNNPYRLDNSFANNSVPLMSFSTTTTQALNKNGTYKIITVANAEQFPDSAGFWYLIMVSKIK